MYPTVIIALVELQRSLHDELVLLELPTISVSTSVYASTEKAHDVVGAHEALPVDWNIDCLGEDMDSDSDSEESSVGRLH
jgi:hypothetical protein